MAQTNHSALSALTNLTGKAAREARQEAAKRQTRAGAAAGRGKRRI